MKNPTISQTVPQSGISCSSLSTIDRFKRSHPDLLRHRLLARLLVLKFLLPVVLLFSNFMLLFPWRVEASNFRGGHLTWSAADSNTVTFKFIAVFRLVEVKRLFGKRTLAVDSLFTDTIGDIKLFFGDDSAALVENYRVMEIDTVDHWVRCEALDPNSRDSTIVHRYESAFDSANEPWRARIEGCCRIDTLENVGLNSEFKLLTSVIAKSGKRSPESSTFAPVVTLAQGGERTFEIPVDSVDEDVNLVWRLAEDSESGIPANPFLTRGDLLSVDEFTGKGTAKVTADTDMLLIGGQWATQIVIEERNMTNGTRLKPQVAVDFIIKIEENSPPQFVQPTPVCGDTLIVTTGKPLNFTVQAADEDSLLGGDEVTLDVEGLPVNAMLVTAPGNPASGEVSWVPAVCDTGVRTVTFFATDITGATSSCSFAILVRDTTFACTVDIIAPQDGGFLCGDSTNVIAVTEISGGAPPYSISCDMNGRMATVAGDTLSTTVPLQSGQNLLIAVCTIVDSCGRTVVCLDTIRIQPDDIAPQCTYTGQGTAVTGQVFDAETGIASIIPVTLENLVLSVDPFTPGDRKVNFRLDLIDLNKPLSFSLDVVDICGNVLNCDPVYLNLSADRDSRLLEVTFPSIDRYFELTNHGLSEVRVDLNGQKFSLFSDSNGSETEVNAYHMPKEGTVTIDLQPQLLAGDNKMILAFEGNPGTSAEILISDALQDIDYILDIQKLPVEFRLAQNYPNPFNPTTRIRYDLPDKLIEGAQVQLRIFNLRGELVRALVDEHMLPGQFTVEWDGRDRNGQPVASGIYVYQIVADDFRQSRRMILLK